MAGSISPSTPGAAMMSRVGRPLRRQAARELLGYGESKVRMLIISGDLRSLKDGRSRPSSAGVGR